MEIDCGGHGWRTYGGENVVDMAVGTRDGEIRRGRGSGCKTENRARCTRFWFRLRKSRRTIFCRVCGWQCVFDKAVASGLEGAGGLGAYLPVKPKTGPRGFSFDLGCKVK